MAETPTFWLVICSHEYDGWNGREWAYEDADDVALRGYFTSKEGAQGYVETEQQKLIAEGRAKDDAELVRKNAEAEKRYLIAVEEDKIKRAEYDVLADAGLVPSFQRPPERKPFTPAKSRFDGNAYLRALRRDWEIVEVESHE
jgi:hypothetical protein